MPSQLPLAAPYFSIASLVYCEQLGVNRQCCPSIGLRNSWYMRIMARRIFFII